MDWMRSLWSRIAGLTEQIKEKETAQLVNVLALVCGLLLLFGLLADPIVGTLGGTVISNIVWLAIAVAGSGLMVWLIYHLLKRGYSNIRG